MPKSYLIKLGILFFILAGSQPVKGQNPISPAAIGSETFWSGEIGSYKPILSRPLPENQTLFSFSLNHANFWGDEPEFLIDSENSHFYGSFLYGLEEFLTIGVVFNGDYKGGGFLDRFIEEFHKELGFAAVGRPDNPQNQTRLRVGDSYTKGWGGFNFHNPRLKLFLAVMETDLWSMNLDIELILPFKHALKYNIVLGNHFKISNDFHILVYVGIEQHFNPHRYQGIKLKRLRKIGIFNINWKLNKNLVLIYQYHRADSLVENQSTFGILAKSTNEFYLGIRYLINEKQSLELGVIENSVNDSNTPDFGFHVNFKLTLK